jgi:hypothetical protein
MYLRICGSFKSAKKSYPLIANLQIITFAEGPWIITDDQSNVLSLWFILFSVYEAERKVQPIFFV